MGPLSLHIRLFGPPELVLRAGSLREGLTADEAPVEGGTVLSAPSSPTARSLLAYLVLQHDRWIPRDRLLGLFWPERPDVRARRALSNTLWQVRQALGPAADRLVAEGDTVAFTLRSGDWLDVDAFQDEVGKGGHREGAQLMEKRSHLGLSRAVDLYRADFLEACYDDWALVERERLRELYLGALQRLIALHRHRGDFETALTYAQRLAAADPLRESAHREVMRLYHVVGRPRAALEQFATLCELLAEELGVSPTPATVAIGREITAQLGELGSSHLPVTPPPPPLLNAQEHLPFVGRTRQRTALVDALQAARQGHGGVALVEGEAGVGKTRLINEVVAAAQWRGFQVALSKADSLVPPAPYHLLREALSPLLTPLRTAQLARLVDPEWLAVAAPILAPIADHLPQFTPPVPLAPHQDQERLCQGLIHCVTTLASVAPLLIVVEDIHWADETTLGALPTLVPGISAGRVLIILSCRSAEARMRPIVWETLAAVDRTLSVLRLQVAPFDRAEAVALVQRALRADGQDAAAVDFGRRLQDETGGNALFLVESLKSLLEQGVLELADGQWRFPPADLPLPLTSLRELVRRSLTRLFALPQAVLEHVAVLGEDAVFPVLHQMMGAEPRELAHELSRLTERGFLTETETAYSFQHDVIRDVVYEAIALDRRQALHRDAGAALEALHPVRAESLALHFERGEVWIKAAHWYRQAGGRARSVYAGAQAVTYYDRALDAWRKLPPAEERLGLQLHRERGRICQDQGWFERAEADFRAAHRLARGLGDGCSQARVLNHLSYLSFQRGDFGGAVGIAQQALDLAIVVEHEPEIATALFNQANARRNLGDCWEAIDLYEQAATVYEMLDDQARLADCLNRMGGAFNHVGVFPRALELMHRALIIRRRLEDRLGISYSLSNLAVSHYYAGQFDSMREAAREALEIATDIGDPYGQDAALHNLGVACLEQGMAAEAIPFFERALAIAREIGDRALEPESLAELGRAYLQLGDLIRAQELLEQALCVASLSIEQAFVPPLHAQLALLYLVTGQNDRALQHAESAVREAEAHEDRWASGLSHRAMGQVIEQVGQTSVGSDPAFHFETSMRIQREIGAGAELGRSLAAYSLYLWRTADPDQARRSEAFLDEARALFHKLGMAGDLARLNSAREACRPSCQIVARLPAASAPVGRTLRDDEYVDVTWTVVGAEDVEIAGKVTCRRRRILQLLHEAAAQSACPTVEHLAAALGVSPRTIKRDLAALRADGHEVHTRGSRAGPG